MKRPTTFHSVVIEEILLQHKLSSNKDVDTFNRRLIKEGDSFATITLPSFGSAIEAGLERGFLTRDSFPGFKSRGSRGPLPAFLQGLVRKVFDIDGTLRSDADPDAIFGIRQICYWQKKPRADCSPRRLRAALTQFLSTEAELSRLVLPSGDSLEKIGGYIYGGDIFRDISSDILVCRHGPGATAERLKVNQRKKVDTWSERLDAVLPQADHTILNYGWYEGLSSSTLLSDGDEPPVRVVFVPKTMKTPRVIAIEPSHVQFAQQSVMNYLTERLENHPSTKHSVHFTDQSVNKQCAERASVDRRRATLDLSEASDRVSLALVRRVFARSPILPFLLGTRSTHATLDDGKTSVELLKFASMGSATCFPVEAMVFYALIQLALHDYYQVPISPRSVRRFSRQIDVYGDDLIVPNETRGIVTATLEAHGLKVNVRKSFSNGFFRESCGGDYYKGYDVTPVYLRHIPPSARDPIDVEILASLCATSDLLYKRGLWTTSQEIRTYIEAWSKARIPRTYIAGEGLTFYSYRHMTDCRYDNQNCTYVQKRLVFHPLKRRDEVADDYMLLEALRPPSRRRVQRRDAYFSFPSARLASDGSFSVKRGVFKLKHRWIPATLGRREG